jgi:hypothetical protein
MHNCELCYQYRPHEHGDRLSKIPSKETIFVCGNADISFCSPSFTRTIIERVKEHNQRCPYKTYYFQSKEPAYFAPFLAEFPDNAILLTTLETNRDEGYEKVSKAPLPSERYRQFKALDYPRKVVTIEPVMDFDLPVFLQWVRDLRPEYVWLGFNSKTKFVTLSEPSPEKLKKFAEGIARAVIPIKPKDLRGIELAV